MAIGRNRSDSPSESGSITVDIKVLTYHNMLFNSLSAKENIAVIMDTLVTSNACNQEFHSINDLGNLAASYSYVRQPKAFVFWKEGSCIFPILHEPTDL